MILFFYVEKKHDGGWIIYSSDTRVPAIVAYSETGSFDNLMQIDGARLWIQSVIDDMDVIKNLPDDKLNFSDGDIACNKAFWKSISSPDEYVKQNILKAIIPPDKGLTPIKGHYEFRYSESYSEPYDTVSRMITTNWHQEFPFNIFCPRKSSGPGNAPAGCVAIAGAQMLFYLHENLHVPTTAPSKAYCDGDINSYTWDQTNYTSDIWDEMERDSVKAAPLIANVGKRLNMKYGDNGSGAQTKDLVKKCLFAIRNFLYICKV